MNRLSILEKFNIMPEHLLNFRHNPGTPEHCHRIIALIRHTLENEKKNSSAVFLNVQQAFHMVWHNGLLKKLLPTPFYILLKLYLSERQFFVKVNDQISEMYAINSGFWQVSVLGSILYNIFTLDNNIL